MSREKKKWRWRKGDREKEMEKRRWREEEREGMEGGRDCNGEKEK
jgi:hypothetical protein